MAGDKFSGNGYTWMQLTFGRGRSGNVYVAMFQEKKTYIYFPLSSPRRIIRVLVRDH
jgi:hypothetical protein